MGWHTTATANPSAPVTPGRIEHRGSDTSVTQTSAWALALRPSRLSQAFEADKSASPFPGRLTVEPSSVPEVDADPLGEDDRGDQHDRHLAEATRDPAATDLMASGEKPSVVVVPTNTVLTGCSVWVDVPHRGCPRVTRVGASDRAHAGGQGGIGADWSCEV